MVIEQSLCILPQSMRISERWIQMHPQYSHASANHYKILKKKFLSVFDLFCARYLYVLARLKTRDKVNKKKFKFFYGNLFVDAKYRVTIVLCKNTKVPRDIY